MTSAPHPDDAIRATGLSKRFKTGRAYIEVLKSVDFDARHGDLTMVMGPSGSGKSTLMNILGCLDNPSTGTYHLSGQDVSRMSEAELSSIALASRSRFACTS